MAGRWKGIRNEQRRGERTCMPIGEGVESETKLAGGGGGGGGGGAAAAMKRKEREEEKEYKKTDEMEDWR